MTERLWTPGAPQTAREPLFSINSDKQVETYDRYDGLVKELIPDFRSNLLDKDCSPYPKVFAAYDLLKTAVNEQIAVDQIQFPPDQDHLVEVTLKTALRLSDLAKQCLFSSLRQRNADALTYLDEFTSLALGIPRQLYFKILEGKRGLNSLDELSEFIPKQKKPCLCKILERQISEKPDLAFLSSTEDQESDTIAEFIAEKTGGKPALFLMPGWRGLWRAAEIFTFFTDITNTGTQSEAEINRFSLGGFPVHFDDRMPKIPLLNRERIRRASEKLDNIVIIGPEDKMQAYCMYIRPLVFSSEQQEQEGKKIIPIPLKIARIYGNGNPKIKEDAEAEKVPEEASETLKNG